MDVMKDMLLSGLLNGDVKEIESGRGKNRHADLKVSSRPPSIQPSTPDKHVDV